MPLQKAEALFAFKPTAPVELELKKGDIIRVRRTSVGEGWWEGELNGKRGLFPSSFVKMLPASAGASPVRERPIPPLTPGTSKKAFMETLLTPSTNVQEQLYDKDKASDLFVQGHSDISVSAGPRWDCFPPTLTIVIKDLHTETRFSGVKHFTVFDVETKQLGTQVTRRYKNFLWLYDKMAEMFPCVSLPPLPVKQFSGSALEDHGIEARRRGLEKFLNRVASHPVLGSTKLLHDFLTEKGDKDWKIGRQLSNIKLPKSAKKLFTAPVYCTIKYPPFNVPINQLPSIEKFSKFSRLMELQIQALQNSCQQLCHSNGEMMSKVSHLGKDIQKMARGSQPNIVARRKVTPTHTSNLSVPNGGTPFHPSQRAPSDIEEEDSEGEMDDRVEWNWRDDSTFNCMMRELYDVAGGMKKLANLHEDHQESVERNVLDKLADYVGIIHTLPTLVRLHEEAMETYNASKEKDTKKEAEEIRQHCETLNNVILAEFDYFSSTMVHDFETIILNLLKEQAKFHRRVAKSWDTLYESYINRRSSRHPQGEERITSSGKTFSFDKSGSFTGSFGSSRDSSDSFEASRRSSEGDSTLVQPPSPSESSKGATNLLPTYINVERMDPKQLSDSWEKIDDSRSLSPLDKAKLAAENESSTENPELYESVIVHQIEGQEAGEKEEPTEQKQEAHSYANIEFVQPPTASAVPKPKSAPSSPKKAKKPMPIKRKIEGESHGSSSLTSSQEMTNSSESNSSPATKARVPKKPLPPAKPQRPIADEPSPVKEERPSFPVNATKLNQLIQKTVVSNAEKRSAAKATTSPLLERRARSKTTLDGTDKKQPILPPIKPQRLAKTTDNLPSLKEKEEKSGGTTTFVVHHPAIKPKLSEPLRGRGNTGPTQPATAETSTHTGREELMRKLSLRRQRLEQQLGAHKATPHKPNIVNITETPSERNSTISTSSSHSEVVVAYSTSRADDSTSSNGTAHSGSTDSSGGVVLRKHPEDDNLAKYGIIEDTEGGSFVV